MLPCLPLIDRQMVSNACTFAERGQPSLSQFVWFSKGHESILKLFVGSGHSPRSRVTGKHEYCRRRELLWVQYIAASGGSHNLINHDK